MTFYIGHNGWEALEILARVRELPDILFMDVNMPVMNGTKCVLSLRANPRYDAIPVIMTSTYINPDNPFFKKTPNLSYLKKPSNMISLLNDVEAILQKTISLSLRDRNL